jgi:hypothetical protein
MPIKRLASQMKPFCRAARFGLIVRQSRGVGRYTGGPLAPGRGAGRRAESILGRVSPARPHGGPLARGSRPDLHGLPPGTNLRPSRKRRKPCDPGAGELRRSRDGARIGHSAPLGCGWPATTGSAYSAGRMPPATSGSLGPRNTALQTATTTAARRAAVRLGARPVALVRCTLRPR